MAWAKPLKTGRPEWPGKNLGMTPGQTFEGIPGEDNLLISWFFSCSKFGRTHMQIPGCSYFSSASMSSSTLAIVQQVMAHPHFKKNQQGTQRNPPDSSSKVFFTKMFQPGWHSIRPWLCQIMRHVRIVANLACLGFLNEPHCCLSCRG